MAVAMPRRQSDVPSVLLKAIGQDSEREPEEPDGFMQRFVMLEGSNFWLLWNLVLVTTLLYMATVFPYSLCFLQELVNVIFYVDLLMGFFVAYRDHRGREVTTFHTIARTYFTGVFWINLFACLPFQVVETFAADDTAGTQRAVRLVRLQKLMKLIKVLRTSVRIFKLIYVYKRIKMISNWRRRMGWQIRIASKFIVFFATVHLMACFMYLCAAFHETQESRETWVARAGIWDDPPMSQWITSCYWVLTIFTSVGSNVGPKTTAEQVCFMITMIVGTVVNAIIMGEIIDSVAKANKTELQKAQLKNLMGALSRQTDLDSDVKRAVCSWIDINCQTLEDYEDIQNLSGHLMSSTFPKDLMERLSRSVFHGQLRRNRFVVTGTGLDDPTPALPVFVAMATNRISFQPGELVYDQYDDAKYVYLVLGGTFTEIFASAPTDVMMTRLKSSKSTMTDVISQAMMQDIDRPLSQGARPFRVWSSRNYFGEVELFEARRRMSAVRCEKPGAVLSLSKERLVKISQEHPDMGKRWRSAAARRRTRSKQLMKESQDDRAYGNCDEMSSTAIQRWWRDLLLREELCRTRRSRQTSLDPFSPLSTGFAAKAHMANSGAETPRAESPHQRLLLLEDNMADVKGSLGRIEKALSFLAFGCSSPDGRFKL